MTRFLLAADDEMTKPIAFAVSVALNGFLWRVSRPEDSLSVYGVLCVRACVVYAYVSALTSVGEL